MNPDYYFTIIGAKNVGKTTFINRFVKGTFNNENDDEQVINFDNIKIHISTYPNINVDGLILMFDIHELKTFEYIEKYFEPNKPIVLVGNKSDIKYIEEINDECININNDNFINPENRSYVKKWRELQQKKFNIDFYEMSAKSNYNIEKPFANLIYKLNIQKKNISYS